MKKVLLMMLGTLIVFPASSAVGDEFDYDWKGQTVNYTVLDEEAKTVEVKAGPKNVYGTPSAPGTNIAGSLTIPKTVFRDVNGEDVPYEVTSIGDGAFYKCEYLQDVTISASITSIGDYAFAYCKKLTSINIPETVTSIGQSCFHVDGGSTTLATISIPASVKKIGAYAFSNRQFTKAEFASIESLCSIEFGNYFSNPLRLAQLYIGGEEITELELPETLTSIGPYVFSGLNNIASVNIPYGVTSIGDGAFQSAQIESVTIPETVESIGSQAFSSAKLKTLNIPNSVTSIGEEAFKTNWMTELTISNSLTSIAPRAFQYSRALTSVIIPEGVISIGEDAFSNCSKLTSVTIPSSVKTIGAGAFASSFDTAGTVKVDFASIESLCSIQFANSASNPLKNNESRSSNNVHLFIGGEEITDLIIPGTVTSIGSYAFFYCTNLTSVTVLEGVTTIGDQAFYLCTSMTSVTLPSSVNSVGEETFKDCFDLRLLDLYETSIPDDQSSNIVTDLNGRALLYLPKNSDLTSSKNVVVKGKCKELLINRGGGVQSNQLLLKVPHAFKATTVTVNRNFQHDIPYTLYLPFAINDVGDYGKFYTDGVYNADEEKVYFNELVGNQTTPNTPYMFLPTQDSPTGISLVFVDVVATPDDTESDGLNGVYAKKEFTESEVASRQYYGWTNEGFCWADTGAKIDACRAYYKLSASAAASAPALLKATFGEIGTTGINNIDREENEQDAPIYNLNGQRVGPDYRGVVIKNGEKIINPSH